MKAFLLICTSMWSSILSSLFIVWFDRHELIMNDQAMPLQQNRQRTHTVHGHRGGRRVSFLYTGHGQSSSALPLIFFQGCCSVTRGLCQTFAVISICLAEGRTNIQASPKVPGHTSAGLHAVYAWLWCENSGSVLRWCPNRRSDPCFTLIKIAC